MKVGDTTQGGTAVQLVTLQMCTHTCGVRTTTWLSYSHITLDNIVNHLTCRATRKHWNALNVRSLTSVHFQSSGNSIIGTDVTDHITRMLKIS